VLRKISLISTSVILFAIAAFVIIKLSDKISIIQTFIPEKIAVFKQVHMSGREGSDSWEIYAHEGWTGRDKNVTTFEFVTKAEIDKGGRPLLKDLTARRMKVSRNKDIEILKKAEGEKDGKRYLDALIDFNAVSNKNKKRKFSTITADVIKFNPNTKQALITGNIRILKDKMTIRSERISIDLDANIATFEGRSFFIKKDSKLSADSAVSYFDEDRIFMSGSIEVKQKNKTAVSDNATYDDKSKTVVLSSNVKAVIVKLKNIMKEKSAEKVKGEEAKGALQEKTVITCNRLRLSTENGDCTAYGKVLVSQKDKEAKSDEAFYQEESENIILTGNVYMKRKNDWVKANKVIVSVDKETFEAIGAVETIFKVKKGSKR
jgi:lipopolysaccharide assembly outer membrane protein LptD (OstA)